VKREIQELIQDVSNSLTNVWDLTAENTNIRPDKLDKAHINGKHDYFYRYYLGKENISSARTHHQTSHWTLGELRSDWLRFFI
jgi:hypothetical protein